LDKATGKEMKDNQELSITLTKKVACSKHYLHL